MELIIELLLQYGWQSVVVAVITFLLIELLKPLARKVLTTKQVRHTMYWLLSYAISLGLTVGLAAILGRFGEWTTLYGSTVVVVSILAPVISNIGFWDWLENLVGELWSKLSDKRVWKVALKAFAQQFNIDLSVIERIVDMVTVEYQQQLDSDAKTFLTDSREELTLNIKQKLAGFVSNDQLQEAAEGLFTAIKESLVGLDESVEVAEEA